MKIKNLVLAVAAFGLFGCAGTPVDFDKARSVKVGMTERQLVEVMGKPYMVTAQGNRQVWVYSHANAFSGTKTVSFIMSNGAVAEVPVIPQSFK